MQPAKLRKADKPTNLKQTGAPEGNETDVVFSRPRFSRGAQSQANESVERLAIGIASHWDNAPKIVVAFDMNDERIPERVRMEDQKQRSGGASGAPEGFYYKGTVYLMSSKLATPEDVARVLFHEALGHHGLRSVFGKKLNSILNRIVMARKAEVDAKMAQYGLKGISKVDRLTAAEEVLAELAQDVVQKFALVAKAREVVLSACGEGGAAEAPQARWIRTGRSQSCPRRAPGRLPPAR